MKVGISFGEAYNVLSVLPEDCEYNPVEVDDFLLVRWKIAFEQFRKVQEDMLEHLQKAGEFPNATKDMLWEGFDPSILVRCNPCCGKGYIEVIDDPDHDEPGIRSCDNKEMASHKEQCRFCHGVGKW
jgi:hypothetical protein